MTTEIELTADHAEYTEMERGKEFCKCFSAYLLFCVFCVVCGFLISP